MKESTLRPGKIPSFVEKLRKAVLKELDAPGTGEKKVKPVKFDGDHKRTPRNDVTQNQLDNENGVARYAGQNCPHVGNGSGGIR